MATEPYRTEQYAGDDGEVRQAVAREGIATRALFDHGGVGKAVEDLRDVTDAANRTDAYVAAVESMVASDGLGTQAGPSAAGTVYKSIPHARLYSMTHENIDPPGVYRNGASWNEMGNQYASSADSILKAVSASEGAWQGEAAENMRTALTRVATWLGHAGQGAQVVSAQLYAQSEAASTVKNAVPEPSGFDARAAVTSLLTGGPVAFLQGIHQQAQAANEAHTAAAEAVGQYERSLQQATATVPAFVAPPGSAAPSADGSPSGDTHPAATTNRRTGAVSGQTDAGQSPHPVSSPVAESNSRSTAVAVAGAVPSETATTTPSNYGVPAQPTTQGRPASLTQDGNVARGGPSGPAVGGPGGARSGAGTVGEPEPTRTGAVTTPEEKAGLPGIGAMGTGGKRTEDKERKSSSRLRNDELGKLITDGMRKTVPPTIGEPGP